MIPSIYTEYLQQKFENIVVNAKLSDLTIVFSFGGATFLTLYVALMLQLLENYFTLVLFN